MYIIKPDSTPLSLPLSLSLSSVHQKEEEKSSLCQYAVSNLCLPPPSLPLCYLQNALKIPFALLSKTQNLPSFLSEIGLTAVADDVFKEDRLPCLLVLLTLSGLFSLGLLEGDLDLGCLGVLLGQNGFGDARPQAKRFVGKHLLAWGQDLGRNVEWDNVNNNVLLLRRDQFL